MTAARSQHPQFIGYDIVPVVILGHRTSVPHPSYQSARRMSDTVFWCLYGIVRASTSFRIAEFDTYEKAADIYSRITGCAAPRNPALHRLLELPATT
jgi:hypothetical protein